MRALRVLLSNRAPNWPSGLGLRPAIRRLVNIRTNARSSLTPHCRWCLCGARRPRLACGCARCRCHQALVAQAVFLRPPRGPGQGARGKALRRRHLAAGQRARTNRLRNARQDQVRHRQRALQRRAGSVPRHLLPSRPLLPDTGPHACARSRQWRQLCARDPLRQRLLQHAARQPGAQAARRCRLCRVSPAGEPHGRPAEAALAKQRLGRVPWRFVLPRHRRAVPVRPVGTRRRTRRGHARPGGGIPELHPLLLRAAGAGLIGHDGVRAARRAERHRRLQVRDAARSRGADGHRGAPLPATWAASAWCR